MLALVAGNHANGLADDVEVEVFEVVVGGEGEVLVDIVLISSPEADVYIRFVPSHFFYTLEARVYVLQYVNYIIF